MPATEIDAPPAAPGDGHPAPGRSDARRLWSLLAAAAVGAVLIAGVVLRFVTTSPLWLDEALTVNIARLPLGEIPDALRQDGHPPLYYVLLHAWMQLFGESDVAARALSGVLAVLALPLAWLAGRRLGGRRLAWAAVVVLAVTPYVLRYATEVRMYSLVMLLVLVGYLLIGPTLERPTWPRLVGVGLVSGALVLTQYWSFYLLAAVVMLLVLRARSAQRRRSSLVVVAAVAVGAVACFLPWLPVFLDQLAATGTPWAGPARPTNVLMATIIDVGGGLTSEGQLLGVTISVLVLLALFGRAVDPRTIELDLRTVPQVRTETAVSFLTMALGVVAAYVTASAFASRYASVIVPLLVLVVAAGVVRFDAGWVRALVLAFVVGLSLAGGYRNVVTDRTQGGEVVSVINEEAAPGDLVAYCPDQLGPAFSRGLRDDLVPVVYPTFAPPDRVDWRDYAERNEDADPVLFAEDLLARAGPDQTIWYVWQGGYRTFEESCESVHKGLLAARPAFELVVPSNAGIFEPANLSRFSPA